jgi:hypothetical protein
MSKPISMRFLPIYKICFQYYTKLEVLIEIHFLEHKVLEFSSVHGYLKHYSRQEFSCSFLPVEPEAVSSLWEATVFDKCIKNVHNFITIIEILT